MTRRPIELSGWAYLLAAVLLVYVATVVGFAGAGGAAGAVATTANLFVQSGLWLASCAAALAIARRAGSPSRRLMLVLAAVCLTKAVSDATWNLQDTAVRAPATGWAQAVKSCPAWLWLERSGLAAEVLYNLGWVLFLVALAWAVYSVWRPSATAAVTIAVLMPVAGAIFALVYWPGLRAAEFSVACVAPESVELVTAVSRNLAFVSVGVQVLGVGAAIAVSMAPLLPVYRLTVAAYLLLVASDFVMWTEVELGQNEGFYWNLTWVFAIALLFAALNTTRLGARDGRRLDSPLPAALGPNRSRLAGIATLVTVVPIAVTILLGELLQGDPDHLVAVSFLLLTAVLVLAAAVSSRSEEAFDRFVDTIVGRITHRPVAAPSGGDRLFYELTNLAQTAELIDEKLDSGLDRLLMVGTDGRFRLGAPERGSPPTCFVIMPFGPAWADGVYEAIRETVEERGYRCIRGDDFFGANEIMDDVWRQMRGAELLIADLTGRNPNVFYEVGMAHTLGLPILLLSQSVDDIPFDLASRRVIQYDPGEGTKRLQRSIELALAEIRRG